MKKLFISLLSLVLFTGMRAQAPQGFTARIQGQAVKLSWEADPVQKAEHVTDDLEGLTAGDIGGIDVRKAEDYDPESNRKMLVNHDTGQIGPYKLIDNDHLATDYVAWAWGKGIPDLGQGMVCQVLDTKVYDNSTTSIVGPHSGSKFLCFWTSNPQNDDYFILPQLSPTDKHISFWAKSLTNKYGLEKFSLAISKTGTRRSDFTDYQEVANIPAGYISSKDAGYKFYEFDLPADTRYVAIHYNNTYCAGLFIDDISYSTAETAEVKGYNVYRDGTLLTSQPITATDYIDSNVTPGLHSYKVSAIYNAGEQMSEPIEILISAGLVENPPQGTEMMMYSHSAFGYYYLNNMVCYEPDDAGYATPVAKSADGIVYIKNPISQLKSETWFQGHLIENGSKVAFDFPQLVHRQGSKDFYAYRMRYKESGSNKTYVADPETQTLTFNVNPLSGDYTLIPEDKDALLGLMSDDKWTGYGDKDIVFNHITATPLAMPEGLEQQDWQLNYNNVGGRKVKIAFSDNKVYIQGIDDQLPEACVIGTLENNQLTVEGSQYFGINADNYHSFLVPAFAHKTWSTAQDAWIETPIVLEKMTFDVDMDAKRMTPVLADSALWVINPVPDRVTMRGRTLRNPIIVVPPTVNPDALPAKPVIVEWVNDYNEYGFASLRFILPLIDEDYNTIDKATLYFRLWVNDEPLTLTSAVYQYITEETDRLPYGHFDNLDFWFYDDTQQHLAFFYGKDGDKVGVQSIRMGENGKEYLSPVAWVDDMNGVESTIAGEPAKVEYYDLQGRQLSVTPQSGLYIQRITSANGEVRTRKIMVK